MDFQSKLVNFLNTKKKEVQQVFNQAPQAINSFGNNLRQQVQPIMQQGQASFWNKSNPIANTWLNLQKATPAFQQGGAKAFEPANFLRNNRSIADYIPRLQAPQNANILQKAPSFIANMPIEMGANIVGRAVVDPITDIGRLWGNAAQGQQAPQYDQLKSPLVRAGYNTTGINNTPQQMLGNTAGVITPILDAYSGGFLGKLGKTAFQEAGKQTFKKLLTKGALEGGTAGTIYGGLQGLIESRDKTLEEQLKGTAQNAVLGAGLGFVGGGALSGASTLLGKILNKTPEVIGQLRDAGGRWVKGQTPVKPQAMSKEAWKFQIEFNKKYNRNPYTPVYPEDLQKAVTFELEQKGAGLSIRDVTKELYPTQQPKQQLGDVVNPQTANQQILNDTVSGQYETFGQTQPDNAFKLNVPQTKVKPQMQIKKEVRNDEFNQFARRSGSDSINFKKVGETIGVPFEDDFGKGVYKYWKNGQPQAQIRKEVGGYKKGEEVGFAGILSPEGEARKGKFVRKVNEHLVEIDYGDHKELNHIKNIYKLDQINSPLKSHTQLATEAKNRGYNDKNLLANIHNVKEELMEEHDSYRKYMVGIVNKYADKTSKTKSIRELMNPEEIKTMNELSAKSDRAYNLLKSEQSPQTKQFTQLGSATNTRADQISTSVRKETDTEWQSLLRNAPESSNFPLKRTSIDESAQLSNTPTKDLGISIKRETAQNAQAFESTQDILQRQQSKAKVGETLEQIIDKPEINVKQKVNLLDYVRTPDRVLQKVGLGDEAILIRKKYDDYLKELPENIGQITQWSNRVGKESNQRIFQYLDGQKITLDANEQQVANEIRDWLKTWADRLKLPEDRRITNYITHLFDKEMLNKEFDPELARLIRDRIPGSVYDPFVQERLGKMGFKEDVWGALDAYVKRATRKVHMDEALEKVSAKADQLEDSQFRYVKAYVDRINMRPTAMDNLIDNGIKSVIGYRLGQRPTTAITRGVRQMVYRGTLGLNVGSALRNLSQGVNTYAKLGEKYTVLGYTNLVKNWRSGELQRVGVLRDDFIQDRTMNATRKKWEKADKKLFYLFELAEKINRGSAYFGAKARALSQGLSEEQAIEAGKKLVRDTQFTFGSIDTPQVLQSDLAKTLLQFQSYNLKQGEFLAEMVKNKEVAGLVRYTGASMLFMMSAGSLIGMKPTDFIPFWGVLTGQTKLGQTPPVKLGIDIAKTATGAKGQFGEDQDLGDRLETFGNDLVPFVPGGVQLKKTIEGLLNTKKGYSESATGRVKFPIDSTTGNYVRAGLFGTNNLPTAQEYFSKKRKPLGDVQSEEFKKLDSEDRKTFIQDIYNDREQKKIDKKAEEPTSFLEGLINKSSASEEVELTKSPNKSKIVSNVGAAEKPEKKLANLKKQQDSNDKKYKKQAEASGKAVITKDKIYIDKNGNGEAETISLTSNTSLQSSGIDAFDEGTSNASKAREIWAIPNSQLSGSDKEKIFQQLGYTKEEVEYDYKTSSKFSVDERVAYIDSQNLDHDTLIKRLESGRRKSISGNLFASDDVIDTLVADDKITKAEAKILKAIDYDKDGNLYKKKSGGRGKKGKSIDFRQFIRKAPKTRVSKLKAPKIATPVKLKKIGTGKLKEFKFKNKPFSLKKKS